MWWNLCTKNKRTISCIFQKPKQIKIVLVILNLYNIFNIDRLNIEGFDTMIQAIRHISFHAPRFQRSTTDRFDIWCDILSVFSPTGKGVWEKIDMARLRNWFFRPEKPNELRCQWIMQKESTVRKNHQFKTIHYVRVDWTTRVELQQLQSDYKHVVITQKVTFSDSIREHRTEWA